MPAHEITLWGTADLRDFATPKDDKGQRLPFAVAWVIPMNPHIMAGIMQGPNQAYADEYARVNHLINELARRLAGEIKNRGFKAYALAASERTDKVNIKGDFPHKTAATRAGLGWIGRHCQLITRKFGSWIAWAPSSAIWRRSAESQWSAVFAVAVCAALRPAPPTH